MVHSTHSAITSGNEDRGRGRQIGNESGSGSSSTGPPGRSGRRTYSQIIQEAVQAYNVGTPAQVKYLISSWEAELHHRAEDELHVEDWQPLARAPGNIVAEKCSTSVDTYDLR